MPVSRRGGQRCGPTHWRQEHLAYLFGLAFIPNALLYVEGCIPWENITIFLNTLGRSGVVESRFESEDFPQQLSGSGRQLCHGRSHIW
jgi:hypothetical protein